MPETPCLIELNPRSATAPEAGTGSDNEWTSVGNPLDHRVLKMIQLSDRARRVNPGTLPARKHTHISQDGSSCANR